MKKLILKILVGVFAIAMLVAGLTACGGSGYKKPTMTSWGEGNVVGGFIGTKGDYVYYINGNAQADGDNEFGEPIKGSLMVMDKNDFSKTEIVVPKLFVAQDYSAGVYIYGDYVYYATPSTDKDASGEIAYSDLVFCKTKLDGTETEKLFKVESLSTEYRIIQKDGDVFVVYYDKTDLELKLYSVNNDQTTVIASSDVKTENMIALDACKFAENGSDVVVYYTVKVYTEKYYESKTERATAKYNAVYAYKLGDTLAEGQAVIGTEILNGKEDVATYALTFVKQGKLFLTETINTVAKSYVIGADANKVAVDNTSLSDASIFDGENAVYNVVEGKIQKSLVSGKVNEQTVNVAVAENISTLFAIEGDYAYYFDTASGISRIKLNDQTAKSEKVSEDTVTTTWYKPQFVNLNGQTYIFYCDNTAIAASYIKYVNVSNPTINEEDTDEDGKIDLYELTGHGFIGKITDSDLATMFASKVTSITSEYVSGALPYEKDENGKLYVTSVQEAQAQYDALSKSAKKLVSEDSVAQLEKYNKAIEMANVYEKLSLIRQDNLTDAQKAELESTYNSIKGQIEAFKESEDYTAIASLVGNNRLWCYQKAVSLFDAE